MRVLEQGNPLQVAPEPLVALRSPPCPFVDFFFGRRGSAFTPHRISLRPTARLLRLPLKGGVMGLGARASRPHPCSLWGLLSISATLQAATTSAGTATVGSKERRGAVAGGSPCGRRAKLCQDLCGRDARAPGWSSSRRHRFCPSREERSLTSGTDAKPLRGPLRTPFESLPTPWSSSWMSPVPLAILGRPS